MIVLPALSSATTQLPEALDLRILPATKPVVSTSPKSLILTTPSSASIVNPLPVTELNVILSPAVIVILSATPAPPSIVGVRSH